MLRGSSVGNGRIRQESKWEHREASRKIDLRNHQAIDRDLPFKRPENNRHWIGSIGNPHKHTNAILPSWRIMDLLCNWHWHRVVFLRYFCPFFSVTFPDLVTALPHYFHTIQLFISSVCFDWNTFALCDWNHCLVLFVLWIHNHNHFQISE